MKWEKEMKENEKELNKLKKDEESLMQEIRKIESQIEKNRNDIEKYRTNASEIENDINELKKKLSVQNKEINDFRKKINSIEAKLLDKKLERHAILKNSKIELVDLPMLSGSMDDINDEDQLPLNTQQPTDSSEQPTDTLNTLSTNDQSQIFEKESRIKIDYRRLETDLLNVCIIFELSNYLLPKSLINLLFCNLA